MGRQIRKSKGKTMKPNFFVFCEGESEVAYISHLRSQYRAPIQIIPRKSDSNISVRYIENCKREYVVTKNDKTFLMFDLDVDGMLEHLLSIPDAILMVSNPCIELWYLLHFEKCHAELTQNVCIKKLKRHLEHYTKGTLALNEKQQLSEKTSEATARAKMLDTYNNPSTTIYKMIELRIKAAIKSPEILELVNICVINALGYKSKISSKTVDNAIDSIVSFVHSEIDSSNLSDNDKEKEKNSYKHFAKSLGKREFTGGATANIKEVIMDIYNWE